MVEVRPENFDDLFEDKKVYDHISDRKEYLADKLLDPAGAVLPLTRVYPQRTSTDKVLNYLDDWTKTPGKERSITEFSDDPPYVTFKLHNGTPVFSDYICVEYFRLYLIGSEKENLKRYTYFELYYDDYIVTCLMDIATFRKNGAMDCLDMDAKEWAYAKMQMKLWNQAIYPEVEELKQDSALSQRIEKYHRLAESEDTWKQETGSEFQCYESVGNIWAALAYLCSFQMLELLPPKYLPQYVINFVCSSDYFCQALSGKLTAILSSLFENDCYIKGNIPLHSDYQPCKSNIPSICSVHPYILWVQKRGSIKDLLSDLNSFSKIRASKKKWSRHPFRNDVPICISNKEIVDSAVLNIELADQAIASLSSQNYPMPSLLHFFCSLRKKKGGSVSYCTRRKMEKRLDGIRKAVRNICDQSQDDCIKRHRNMFHLSLIFLMIHDIRFRKRQLPDNVSTWFLLLLKSWQTQEATLESAIEQILDMITREAEIVQPGYPVDVDELEHKFNWVCRKDNLILYRQHCLETKISEFCFPILTKDIIVALDEKGVLKKNKGVLTYTHKVGGTPVKFYAFYVDKLGETR